MLKSAKERNEVSWHCMQGVWTFQNGRFRRMSQNGRTPNRSAFFDTVPFLLPGLWAFDGICVFVQTDSPIPFETSFCWNESTIEWLFTQFRCCRIASTVYRKKKGLAHEQSHFWSANCSITLFGACFFGLWNGCRVAGLLYMDSSLSYQCLNSGNMWLLYQVSTRSPVQWYFFFIVRPRLVRP